jgi:uncharacterized protein (TIGR02246 family)
MEARVLRWVASAAAVSLGLTMALAAQTSRNPAKSVEARLRALEDKEAIHAVMMNYGRTLDARDFAGFAELFARDGEYVAGNRAAKGPAAIRELLESLLKVNAAPVSGRDFHLFYNETIEVAGDTATALSKGGFYVRGAERQLQTTALVNYHDQFVREDGRWKFKRRQLGEGPAPASAAPASPQ